jgi:hypothetical protein
MANDTRPSVQTDQTADDIIADCGGDPRAAVIELLAIIRSLIHENQTRESASPGFARRSPTNCLWQVVLTTERPRRAD